MARSDRLELPEDAAALVVLQDGRSVTAGDVRSSSEALAASLGRLGAGRAVLPTDRADHIVVALLACRAAHCDLVLHRGAPASETFVEAMGADILINANLDPEPTGAPRIPKQAAPQIVLTTSGTTGIPRAAGHDLDRLAGLIPEDRPGSAARWLLTYHPASFAGFQVILTALLGQAPLAALARADMVGLTRLAGAFAPTAISGTPTFWRAFLLGLSDEAARLPLRHATLGGEAVDQATLDRIHARFPSARLAHIYASTEAGAVFAVKDGRAGFPAAWLSVDRAGLRLRVVDGVLQLQSPRRMAGYLAGQEAPVDAEGWLDTGDLVRTEGDRVYFCGRRNNVINVGGQKVRPEEIEALILQLPGVADAQAKGMRNPITGELVAVDVVAAPGVDATELVARVKAAARSLPAHAAPRIVKVVPELPMTTGGKKSRA
jgi:acyl-CoA synthetase (AMP-forming)/AMP-acid ligase II